jgi:hypothetical protein
MTEAYGDALAEQAEQNVWSRLADEAKNMPAVDKATLAADIAGIFDPTPASDSVGFVLSVAQGDWLGAGLSVLGMAPYVGDTGKIAKIAKRAPRTAKALEAVLTGSKKLANAGEAFLKNNFTLQQINLARKKATARVREALLDARRGTPNCKDCAKLPKGGKGTLQMPKTKGKWNTPDGKAPTSGTGNFTFDTPVKLPDGRTVKSVEFRNGFPNFDNYTVGGKHTLWEVSGNAKMDGDRLTKMMRETNPSYKPPSSTTHVLHHFEDGTVGYLPREIHDRALGGASHTGGNAVVNNDLF